MSEQNKDPIYKRKWFWVLVAVALIVFAFIGSIDDKDEQEAERKSKAEERVERKAEREKKKEADKAKKEKEQQEQKEDQRNTEHTERFTFGEFTIEAIRTEINDDVDELTFKFNWINQSGKDKAPFTALGYIDVSQGDEILEEISGAYDPSNNSSILSRNHNGGTLPVSLVYKVVRDDPIKIKFGATHEYDDTKEELIIDLD